MKSGVAMSEQEEDLETLREKMVKAADKYGMHHPLVLYYSREIDRVHTNLLSNEIGIMCV